MGLPAPEAQFLELDLLLDGAVAALLGDLHGDRGPLDQLGVLREEAHLLLTVPLRLQQRPQRGDLGIALGAVPVISRREGAKAPLDSQVPLDLLHTHIWV